MTPFLYLAPKGCHVIEAAEMAVRLDLAGFSFNGLQVLREPGETACNLAAKYNRLAGRGTKTAWKDRPPSKDIRRAVRAAYQTGRFSQEELAVKFHTHRSNIFRMTRNLRMKRRAKA